VLFLGVGWIGHRTRFLNLRAHSEHDPRIRPVYREITGWSEGGVIERLPLTRGLRGSLRTAWESAPFATVPRPDVIWTSAGDALAPYAWSQVGPLSRPVILDLDWTLSQQESMAVDYYGRPPRTGLSLALRRARHALARRCVTVFTPWSRWAADGLRAEGVPEERIAIIPPGVDIALWRRLQRRHPREGPLRLLFVGGDLERKGGHKLMNVFRQKFASRCTLDIVTRAPVSALPGVRIHRLEPNSTGLRALYANADLFVMPSLAETFGIATIEAMAAGLPVIVGDIGAAREIVDDGVTGWLIGQTPAALANALERACIQRSGLPGMGARGAEVAAERFDGARNDARIVELVVELSAVSSNSAFRLARGSRSAL
jgi:glycosyltransferase involved in cell wall biosynthesis